MVPLILKFPKTEKMYVFIKTENVQQWDEKGVNEAHHIATVKTK